MNRVAPLPSLFLLALMSSPGHADTFILKDGGKIYGEKTKEYSPKGGGRWLEIKTAFGVVNVPADQVQKTLKTEGAPGVLYAAEICVTAISGAVEKSADGGKGWVWLSGEKAKPQTTTAKTTASFTAPPAAKPPNGLIAPGDRVRTGDDGQIDLDLGFGVVHVAPRSEVEFGAFTKASMGVFRGSMGSRLQPPRKDAEFRIETPQGVMGVKGTTFVIAVETGTRIAVSEGRISFGDAGAAAGQTLEAVDGKVTTREGIGDADRKALDRVRATVALPHLDTLYVPAGSFLMGTTSQEPALADARPQRKVHLDAYRIGVRFVTFNQFRPFSEMTPLDNHAGCCRFAESSLLSAGWERSTDYAEGANEWQKHGFAVPKDNPRANEAACLKWSEAYAFCTWLGGRLPTEAEWERAGRFVDETSGTDSRLPHFISGEEWLADYYASDFYSKSEASRANPFNGAPTYDSKGSFGRSTRGMLGQQGAKDPWPYRFSQSAAYSSGIGFRVCFPMPTDASKK